MELTQCCKLYNQVDQAASQYAAHTIDVQCIVCIYVSLANREGAQQLASLNMCHQSSCGTPLGTTPMKLSMAFFRGSFIHMFFPP